MKISKRHSHKRVVVIGGGTGVFTVLTGLKHSGHYLSAIVTMADDGGSTGVLREEFGILPPGDVRRTLVALSRNEEVLAKLFSYRFQEGRGLRGHAVGNLLLTALERLSGSFEKSVDLAGDILQIQGEVLPVTLDRVRLHAILDDGSVVMGEHAIDIPKRRRLGRIVKLRLVPQPKPNPRALRAIRKADLIVLGPGDLYSSLLPNLVVPGVASALRRSQARKAFVVNLMTKRGETDGFDARDFVSEVEKTLGKGVLDAVVINRRMPSPSRARSYFRKERARPVLWSPEMFRNSPFRVVAAPLLRTDGKLIRHDPMALGRTLLSLILSRRTGI